MSASPAEPLQQPSKNSDELTPDPGKKPPTKPHRGKQKSPHRTDQLRRNGGGLIIFPALFLKSCRLAPSYAVVTDEVV